MDVFVDVGVVVMLGIYPDLPNQDYHKSDGVSRSTLVKLSRSIAHMEHALSQENEESTALIKGSALHDAILLPDAFNDGYAVAPEVNKRTKDGKAEIAAFEAENANKIILSKEDMADVLAMRDSVLSHPIASQILTDGKPEESFYWIDKNTGQLCKCRTDYRRNDAILVDIKTTRDASPKEFQRSIYNFDYHTQAAMYLDGASICTGQSYDTFIFICVENSAPFSVAVYELDDSAILRGYERYRELLETYANYRAGKIEWCGYPLEIQKITLPAWV
jgi:hypothetical protein